MKIAKLLFATLALTASAAFAADANQPALTIYNQNFAVVRQTVPLELKPGVNQVSFTETTAHLEPDSVVLRDPAGKVPLLVLEQNYRSDPVSQELLLSLFEGKTIDFLIQRQDKNEIVPGKIIRSGYVPHQAGMTRYGQEYYQAQMQQAAYTAPIIEMEGKLRFGLPGLPLFPTLGDDTILKPTLKWLLQTDRQAKLDAEISYITGGMSWEADYNIVAPPERSSSEKTQGDTIDLVGWITMDNQSGKTFENAVIKLMAGDVSKLQPQQVVGYAMAARAAEDAMRPAVREKAFDEFHLYTLERPTTLHDRETKQVEFVHATGVKAQRLYVYDGAWIDPNQYGSWSMENIRQDRNYGTKSNPKVWVMQEFQNSEANHLGMPLPKGRLRFYRRDEDGRIEFTGENIIDHTPRDETIRVYTGDSFDLRGERTRTDFKVDEAHNWLDESFEIKLRNHKKEPVEFRVIEHLYRWTNWSISASSYQFKKTNSQTAEFRIAVPPDGERIITYTVHYTW